MTNSPSRRSTGACLPGGGWTPARATFTKRSRPPPRTPTERRRPRRKTSSYWMQNGRFPMPAATTGERRAALCAVAPMSTSVGALSRSASRIGPASASWSPDGSRLPAAWSSGSSTGCGAGSSSCCGRSGRARRSSSTRPARSRAPRRRPRRTHRPPLPVPSIQNSHRPCAPPRPNRRPQRRGGRRPRGRSRHPRRHTPRHRTTSKTKRMPGSAIGQTRRSLPNDGWLHRLTDHAGGGGKQPDRRQQGKRRERERTPERRSRETRDQELESVVMRVARYMDSPDRRAPTVRTGSVHSTGRRLSSRAAHPPPSEAREVARPDRGAGLDGIGWALHRNHPHVVVVRDSQRRVVLVRPARPPAAPRAQDNGGERPAVHAPRRRPAR